jgi:DNA-binding transcriptional regulator YiaG
MTTNKYTIDDSTLTDITEQVIAAQSDPAVIAAREEIAAAQRAHKMTLAGVRHAVGLTQVELAARLGITQASVAQTERRTDLLLSTLTSYLAALGTDVAITATLANGEHVRIELEELTNSLPA